MSKGCHFLGQVHHICDLHCVINNTLFHDLLIHCVINKASYFDLHCVINNISYFDSHSSLIILHLMTYIVSLIILHILRGQFEIRETKIKIKDKNNNIMRYTYINNNIYDYVSIYFTWHN